MAVGTPHRDRPRGMPWAVRVDRLVIRSDIPSDIFLGDAGRLVVRRRPSPARRWRTERAFRNRMEASFCRLRCAQRITIRERRSFSSSPSRVLTTGDLVSGDAQASDFRPTAFFAGMASIVSIAGSFSPIHFSLDFPPRVGPPRPLGSEAARAV